MSELEVIVVVEGIEPYSSNTFQARHSYMHSDVVFDAHFAPCMSVDADGMPRLDWGKFHAVCPAPFNATHLVGSSHA